MSATAYPLAWPTGWRRTAVRVAAPFHRRQDTGRGYAEKRDITMAGAREQLQAELDRLAARDVVLSTNVELNLNGAPRGDRARPADVGVACYFTLRGRPQVLACDKWLRVEDNIVAIARHIEALRGQARWGVGTVEQAFTGYQALPAPEPWWEVLGLRGRVVPTYSREDIDAAYRREVAIAHPDKPTGSRAAWDRLQAAYQAAKAARP